MAEITREEMLSSLRRAFKKYLLEQGKGIAEVNVLCNDAFFLANQSLEVSFEDYLEYGLTDNIRNVVMDYFLLSGNADYARTKSEQYFNAMTILCVFYRNHYSATYTITDTNVNQGRLIEYCKSMRLQYSYKPLLLLSLLETGSVNGTTTISEVTLYFINFYNKRLDKGLISEKSDSLFSKKGVSFNDAKQNILSNAVRVLEKDGVLISEGELLKLTDAYLYDYHHHKDKLANLCNEILEKYYSKFNTEYVAVDDQEVMLGSVLQRMHTNASNSEKVIMVQLFGIKYGEVIEKNHLSIKSIIAYAGVPSSYYFEVRKGVLLSRYVIVRDVPLEKIKGTTGPKVSEVTTLKPLNPTESGENDGVLEAEFFTKCYTEIERKLNRGPLEKKKRQIRVDKMKQIAVLCTSSKSYLRKDSDPFFWFGFHVHQREALSTYSETYIAFILKDDKQCLLLPIDVLYRWLPYMSQTEKDNDTYWHIHIYKDNGHYLLNVPNRDKVDLTAYCLFNVHG